jgi:predicted nuclease with RNAse H fold
MSTRIVGIDLAASPTTTAVAVIEDGAVRSVQVDVDDERLLAACAGAAKIGIDCPLGWPAGFVSFVGAHARFETTVEAATIADRDAVVYRATDRWVREQYRPLRPLSVAADRIGHAALRCAGLLAALGERDRSGRGRVVEVYPAGSLMVWELEFRRYKGADGRPVRDRIVDRLARLVDLRAVEADCRASDHALDAVVAALSAAAALAGSATIPPAELAALARTEGWIALPTGLPT